jgi:hypothetical protein
MKIIILAFVFLCSLRIAQAQTLQTQAEDSQGPEPDLYSNAEKFSDSAGRLIQAVYSGSGHILECYIQVVHYTDMINGTRRNALRFFNAQNKNAYLDEDEIGALSLSMHMIHDKILPIPPTDVTEVIYKSRSGFQAGCYTDNKNQWQPYLRLKRRDNTTFVLMKKADFDVFLQILDNVKAKISQ